MSELGVGICAIAEPVRIPASATWFGSDNGMAAIRWNPDVLPWPCVPVKKGLQFAAVRCGDVHVVSCYASPSLSVRGFLDFLEALSTVILDLGGRVILCGDFNAWSTLWGSSFTNTRGEEMERWAAAHDLRLANVGSVPISVRPQGNSIVDLTWATPSVIVSIVGWTVREDLETLSDHVYISFSVGVRSLRPFKNNCDVGRRWILSKMEKKAFDLSLEWACSSETLKDDDLSAGDYSTWMDEVMKKACDASTPRAGRRHPKKAAY
ncbi:reverse transcriptase [Lasius niger]|uniref:Reverse transcriptase n=1 Tax=Lasius niger TaxID=67767 RepID=A0A0J7KCE5_LASNI|nr:reverse transcriptase [Lasius niger]